MAPLAAAESPLVNPSAAALTCCWIAGGAQSAAGCSASAASIATIIARQPGSSEWFPLPPTPVQGTLIDQRMQQQLDALRPSGFRDAADMDRAGGGDQSERRGHVACHRRIDI